MMRFAFLLTIALFAGAGGSIGSAAAAKAPAPADGYTFVFVFDSHAVNPALTAGGKRASALMTRLA